MFSEAYPNITQWIDQQGWIEIGQDKNSISLVRAIDEGGIVWENTDKHISIDQSLQALENYLEK